MLLQLPSHLIQAVLDSSSALRPEQRQTAQRTLPPDAAAQKDACQRVNEEERYLQKQDSVKISAATDLPVVDTTISDTQRDRQKSTTDATHSSEIEVQMKEVQICTFVNDTTQHPAPVEPALSPEEISRLLEVRAAEIVNMSACSSKADCFNWLASAVTTCSSSCIKKLHQKIAAEHGGRWSCPGCTFPRELRDCSRQELAAQCSEGFKGRWKHKQMISVVNFLSASHMEAIYEQLGHHANLLVVA
jgi:hypothetical protein